MVEVKLSPSDVALATNEAANRFNYNRAKGNDPTQSAAPTWVEAVAREISGILGEIAVARWLDKFPFTLFENRKQGDVAGFEVRTTAYSTGKLLLTPRDEPDRKYLLVTLPTFYTANLCGWAYGYEAQDNQYAQEGAKGLYYMMPQEHLRDARELLNV